MANIRVQKQAGQPAMPKIPLLTVVPRPTPTKPHSLSVYKFGGGLVEQKKFDSWDDTMAAFQTERKNPQVSWIHVWDHAPDRSYLVKTFYNPIKH